LQEVALGHFLLFVGEQITRSGYVFRVSDGDRRCGNPAQIMETDLNAGPPTDPHLECGAHADGRKRPKLVRYPEIVAYFRPGEASTIVVNIASQALTQPRRQDTIDPRTGLGVIACNGQAPLAALIENVFAEANRAAVRRRGATRAASAISRPSR
jgi:hypothetical protein